MVIRLCESSCCIIELVRTVTMVSRLVSDREVRPLSGLDLPEWADFLYLERKNMKLNQYQEITRVYDAGSELPEFITKKINQGKVLAEVREELERIPEVDVNADDLEAQYLARVKAFALNEGLKLIEHDRYEKLLEQQLSSAIDVGLNRLIKSLKVKVAADLETLDDSAFSRLLLLTENLPNKLDQGLLPLTSRLMALVKVEGNSSIVSASAREWEKEARTDRRAALKNIKEGYYPYLSLVFISALDDLTQRRKDLGDLLASPTRVV